MEKYANLSISELESRIVELYALRDNEQKIATNLIDDKFDEMLTFIKSLDFAKFLPSDCLIRLNIGYDGFVINFDDNHSISIGLKHEINIGELFQKNLPDTPAPTQELSISTRLYQNFSNIETTELKYFELLGNICTYLKKNSAIMIDVLTKFKSDVIGISNKLREHNGEINYINDLIIKTKRAATENQALNIFNDKMLNNDGVIDFKYLVFDHNRSSYESIKVIETPKLYRVDMLHSGIMVDSARYQKEDLIKKILPLISEDLKLIVFFDIIAKNGGFHVNGDFSITGEVLRKGDFLKVTTNGESIIVSFGINESTYTRKKEFNRYIMRNRLRIQEWTSMK